VLLFALCPLVLSLENGLARTPPMGWNSWNHFGCRTAEITEDMFKGIAKAMVSSGMAAAGYKYINLDDCWLAATRDAQGHLQPDSKRFPSGIKALADFIHSLGLKFGVYEDTGSSTCAGYPGSSGHYELDAQTFASWGVDYVKMDGCGTQRNQMRAIYTQISQALNMTGRPMVYSCSWPAYDHTANLIYVGSICNLWREYNDISDSWNSWTNILDYQETAGLRPYAAPGQWNDPDMLQVGNGGQTTDEYRAHFSLWAILAAPLIAGNDLRNMSNINIEILTAPEVIEVDQDSLGSEGGRVGAKGIHEVWARKLRDSSQAVVLFNRDTARANITVTWEQIGIPVTTQATVRDLWARADLGTFRGSFSATVNPHAVVMVKVKSS